jgi:hypothetical protein
MILPIKPEESYLSRVDYPDRIGLDLPKGQWKLYPAMSAGYCLRASNERSERVANKIESILFSINSFTQKRSRYGGQATQ